MGITAMMASSGEMQGAVKSAANDFASTTEAELKESVRSLLAEILGIIDSELTKVSDNEDLLLSGIGCSSMLLVTWLTAIEKTYKVSLPLEEVDAEEMRSISGVVALLGSQLAEGESR